MLCIDFVLFLKGQIWENLKNWKIRNFWKKHDFEKGMHSYVSNVGFKRNSSRKAPLNEKPRFL